jgi:hypothetical protein
MPQPRQDGRLGYLDVYDRLRTFQRELRDIKGNLRPDMKTLSVLALDTLDGALYLAEGQLMRDADGEN